MPRLPPGIYRRGGRFQVKVYAGRDPATGRKRQLSGTAATLAEAKRLRTRLQAEVDAGRHAGPQATVADLLARWLAQLAAMVPQHRSPASLAAAERHIRLHLAPQLGHLRVATLTRGDIAGCYDRLQLSPAHLHRVHDTLHSALARAVRWGWRPDNPADQLDLPARRRPALRPPTPAEVARLLIAVEAVDPLFGLWLRLQAVTGCRPGESCALRWSHLDLEAGEVLLARAISRGGRGQGLVDRDVTKGGEPRRIALDPQTVSMLREHRRRALQDALACGVRLGDGYVFSSEVDGSRPMRPDSLSKRFRRAADALDLPHVQLYGLRHFAITAMLASGVDVRTVAGRVGHASAKMTLDTYGHFVRAADRRAADLLAEALGTGQGEG
jgi:integrase